jgi:hypothetical protein
MTNSMVEDNKSFLVHQFNMKRITKAQLKNALAAQDEAFQAAQA